METMLAEREIVWRTWEKGMRTAEELEGRLARNLAAVQDEIRAACERAARPQQSVTLVAVTKSASIEAMQGLARLGLLDLAENRAQALLDRASHVAAPVRWHFIGHLQRNKARKVLPLVGRIHSIDSVRLLTFLESLAAEFQVRPRALLEVNVSGEASKGGFRPDELPPMLSAVADCRHLTVDGLMTMAPFTDDEDAIRRSFRGLRKLRDEISPAIVAAGGHPLTELSMGMSGDFPIAIEEGATMVRIGSRLFEGVPG